VGDHQWRPSRSETLGVLGKEDQESDGSHGGGGTRSHQGDPFAKRLEYREPKRSQASPLTQPGKGNKIGENRKQRIEAVDPGQVTNVFGPVLTPWLDWESRKGLGAPFVRGSGTD